MLPNLTPNRALAYRLQAIAVQEDRLMCSKLADQIMWAVQHYAVETHQFPAKAAQDAALCIHYRARDLVAPVGNSR